MLPKIRIMIKKTFKKVVQDSISYKKVSGRLCLSRGKLGSLKIATFKILKCTKMAKKIHFRTSRCQKYALYQKRLQIKVVPNSISYKKVSVCMCLISPRSGAGGPKNCQFQYIIIHISKMAIFGAARLHSCRRLDICAH